MADVWIGLLKDAPWIALTVFLLYKHFGTDVLGVYISGAEHNKSQSDSISNLASSIESMERSLGVLQNSVERTEARIEQVHHTIDQYHASVNT